MYAILLLAALVPGVKMDGVWLDAEAAKARNLVLFESERDGLKRVTLKPPTDL